MVSNWEAGESVTMATPKQDADTSIQELGEEIIIMNIINLFPHPQIFHRITMSTYHL